MTVALHYKKGCAVSGGTEACKTGGIGVLHAPLLRVSPVPGAAVALQQKASREAREVTAGGVRDVRSRNKEIMVRP